MKLKLILISFSTLLLLACADTKKQYTDSGYAYKMYSKGSGEKPEKGNFVSFQMDILNDQGETLYSYRDRPELPSIQVPEKETAGMVTKNPLLGVLNLVNVGDSLGLIIPRDSIPNPAAFDSSTFIEYRLVIKEVLTKEDHMANIAKKREEAEEKKKIQRERLPEIEAFTANIFEKYKNGSLNAELSETESGLKYIIHERGDGKMPENGKMVTVDYYGVLASDGSRFDDSFSSGRPYIFSLGTKGAIAAWDEGVALLPVGTKATLISPPELAYGEGGRPPIIPPSTELIFYVEVVLAL